MPLAGPPATRDDSGTTARDNTPVVPDDSPAIVPATSTTPPLSDLTSDCQPSTGSNPQVGPFLALEAKRMPFRGQATAGSLAWRYSAAGSCCARRSRIAHAGSTGPSLAWRSTVRSAIPATRGPVFLLGHGFREVAARPDQVPAPAVAIWLQVRDAGIEHRRLMPAGVRVLRAPRRAPWELVEMWIEDPDGVRIVLVEVPGSHRCGVTSGDRPPRTVAAHGGLWRPNAAPRSLGPVLGWRGRGSQAGAAGWPVAARAPGGAGADIGCMVPRLRLACHHDDAGWSAVPAAPSACRGGKAGPGEDRSHPGNP